MPVAAAGQHTPDKKLFETKAFAEPEPVHTQCMHIVKPDPNMAMFSGAAPLWNSHATGPHYALNPEQATR